MKKQLFQYYLLSFTLITASSTGVAQTPADSDKNTGSAKKIEKINDAIQFEPAKSNSQSGINAKFFPSPMDPGDSIFVSFGGGSWNSALLKSSFQRYSKNQKLYNSAGIYNFTLYNSSIESMPVGYAAAGFHTDEYFKDVSHSFKVYMFSSNLQSITRLDYLKNTNVLKPGDVEERTYIENLSGHITRNMYDYAAEFHIFKKVNEKLKIRSFALLFGMYGFSDKLLMSGDVYMNNKISVTPMQNFTGYHRLESRMSLLGAVKAGISLRPSLTRHSSLFLELYGHFPSQGRYKEITNMVFLNDSFGGFRITQFNTYIFPWYEYGEGKFMVTKSGSFKTGYTFNSSSWLKINFMIEGYQSRCSFHYGDNFYPVYNNTTDTNALTIAALGIIANDKAKIIDKTVFAGFEVHYKY